MIFNLLCVFWQNKSKGIQKYFKLLSPSIQFLLNLLFLLFSVDSEGFQSTVVLWCMYIPFSISTFVTAWLTLFFWPGTNLLFTLCSKPKALTAPQFSAQKVQILYLLSSTQCEGFSNFSFLSSLTTHCAIPLHFCLFGRTSYISRRCSQWRPC
jgi:hypothetical protein